MITLTIKCEKHEPMVEAISTISHSFDEDTQYSFCVNCEQNIERSSYYDEDRGTVYLKWRVTL